MASRCLAAPHAKHLQKIFTQRKQRKRGAHDRIGTVILLLFHITVIILNRLAIMQHNSIIGVALRRSVCKVLI